MKGFYAYSLYVLVSVCSLTGCQTEDDGGGGRRELVVQSLCVGQARSIIKENMLPIGSAIGLFLDDGSGDYMGKDFKNIPYTAGVSDNGEKQTWNTDRMVYLMEPDATVYAYYPYQNNVDINTGVPVDVKSKPGQDLMLAEIYRNVNYWNPTVSLNMKHVLALMVVQLQFETHSYDVDVTDISIYGPGIATSATVDLKDGCLKDLTGKGDFFKMNGTQTLSQQPIVLEFLFIPDESETDKNVSIVVQAGGNEYMVQTSFKDGWKQGYVYRIPLVFKDYQIEVQDTQIHDFNDEIVEYEITTDVYVKE